MLSSGGFDESSDEIVIENPLASTLGMPLHPHIKWSARVIDRLDHTIERMRNHPQPTSVHNGLMMRGGDRLVGNIGWLAVFWTPSPPHRRIRGPQDDGMSMVVLVDLDRIRQCVRKMLIQPPSGMKRHHLHPQAHPQHRTLWAVHQGIQKRQFKFLPARFDTVGKRMCRIPKVFGSGIVTARQQQPINVLDVVNHQFHFLWQQNG